MIKPKVSVVIPAYNQARFLAGAIQSVLDQTFTDLEIIVVDDDSPDETSQVVSKFADPRIRYIKHTINKGLPGARNTGIRHSSGELIALLDADDYFHPKKLETHVDFYDLHPNVAITYNARFNLDYSAPTIRSLWLPPDAVTLGDLVLGFLFAPSDMVMRRAPAFAVGLFDETLICGGEDLDFPCRLALAGYRFAGIDRALTYRRFHSGRPRKKLECRIKDYTSALHNTFSDPRCPPEVAETRDRAVANSYLEVAWYALSQGETALGQICLRKVIALDPSILESNCARLVDLLINNSIADESVNHEVLLWSIIEQLPPELAFLESVYSFAVARGYLLKGVRNLMWERLADGQAHMQEAAARGATLDEPLLRKWAADLMNYEREFGKQAAESVLARWIPYLQRLEPATGARWLQACYAVNGAFNSYHAGDYGPVPARVLQAIANHPRYLANRGVLAILTRSVLLGIRTRTL